MPRNSIIMLRRVSERTSWSSILIHPNPRWKYYVCQLFIFAFRVYCCYAALSLLLAWLPQPMQGEPNSRAQSTAIILFYLRFVLSSESLSDSTNYLFLVVWFAFVQSSCLKWIVLVVSLFFSASFFVCMSYNNDKQLVVKLRSHPRLCKADGVWPSESVTKTIYV